MGPKKGKGGKGKKGKKKGGFGDTCEPEEY